MSHELAPSQPHANVAETLRVREGELAARERELATLLADLRGLRASYLEEVGIHYARLIPLEEAIAVEEIRLGLRLAEIDAEDVANASADPLDPSCDSRAGVPDGLKKMFRNVAKALHPDLTMDESVRDRRESLMAEANRAYADRDQERLETILRTWEESPESVDGSHPYGEHLRAERRLAQILQRMTQIDAEMNELRDSAVNRLKISMEESAKFGRDLLKQMRDTVEREIAVAAKRLDKLRAR